jgi:hypothetical protein
MLVGDGCVVNVTNDRRVYVGHSRVIEIVSAAPVSSVEARAGIAKTIVNASIEADGNSPVTNVPEIEAVGEGPISGSPE